MGVRVDHIDPLNFPESGWRGRILSAMKVLIPILIGLFVLVGCGEKTSKQQANAKPELKSSKTPDDSGNYIMSEPGTQGGVFSLTLKPDGSFHGVTVTPRAKGDPIIGSWKAEGELLILEGTNKKDSEATKIKFNKTTGKVVSVNFGGKVVPTEELDLLKVKKS